MGVAVDICFVFCIALDAGVRSGVTSVLTASYNQLLIF
jgi:hypothetical protein